LYPPLSINARSKDKNRNEVDISLTLIWHPANLKLRIGIQANQLSGRWRKRERISRFHLPHLACFVSNVILLGAQAMPWLFPRSTPFRKYDDVFGGTLGPEIDPESKARRAVRK